LARTTSRASSAEQAARWTVAANASTALVLRMPCEPMNATFAERGQRAGGSPTEPGVAAGGRTVRDLGIAAKGRP